MDETPEKGDYALRSATSSDISNLAVHHRKMFEEIWEREGRAISPASAAGIEHAYARKLDREMPGGSCRCWVIEKGGHPAASGAVTLVSLVPTPEDPSSRAAYLHSMYTEKAHRRKHLADRIVKEILSHCRTLGIRRVMLNASRDGRRVYERIGFVSSPQTMRLMLDSG